MPNRRVIEAACLPALIARYEEGESLKQLSKTFACSLSTVRNTLDREGVQIRNKGTRPRTSHEIEMVRNEVLALRAQRLTRREITKRLKVSSHLVGRILNEAERDVPFLRRGLLTTEDGYLLEGVSENDPMFVMARGGYVLQHRLVVARFLGRPLIRSETVHHKDLNRSNNSIENLQLRQGSHGPGAVLVCNNCGSHDIHGENL